MKRTRAKQMCYYDREAKATFKVWHPQVKFLGQWCFLPNNDTKSGLEEAGDELEAYEKANAALLEIDSNGLRAL